MIVRIMFSMMKIHPIYKSLKVVSATFGPMKMFKKYSLSIHVVSKTLHKITFLSFPVTSFTFLVLIALFLHILRQDIIEANKILRNNIIVGIILETYANALTQTRSYWKYSILIITPSKTSRVNEWNILLNNLMLIKWIMYLMM